MQAFERIVSIVRCGAEWHAITYTYTVPILDTYTVTIPIDKDYGLWVVDSYNQSTKC
jgi:hypothetical protein